MNNDTPADTYGTTLVFVATTDPIPTCNPNEICYKGNGSDGGTFMANQTSGYAGTANTDVAAGNTITLWASNYRRAGYGFAGWSTDPSAAAQITANNGVVPSGLTIYGPNEDVTMPGTVTTDGLPLYAVWLASSGNMQGWTCPNNTSMPIGSIAALTDNRDNNVYAVAKLADGKCWMVENLRLSSNAILTTSNTNAPFTINGTVSITNDFANNTISNHLYFADLANWCTQNSQACADQSKVYSTTTTANLQSPSDGIYAYGNFYNWYSATAGNGTFNTIITVNGTEYNPTKTNTDIPGSACPFGWRLPTGGDSNKTNLATTSDYYALGAKIVGMAPDDRPAKPQYSASTAAGAKFRKYPANFVYNGYLFNGKINRYSDYGSYLTATAINSYLIYGMGFDSSGRLEPGTDEDYKIAGYAIRCLASS